MPSPKVATYDLQPEMSALQVTDEVCARMANYDLIILNFANPDMVGHTGVVEAGIKAVETVDACVARIVPKLLEVDGKCLITADSNNTKLNEEQDIKKKKKTAVVATGALYRLPADPAIDHFTRLVGLVDIVADKDAAGLLEVLEARPPPRRPSHRRDHGRNQEQDCRLTRTLIKLADPGALVVGPEEWGWSGYLFSGYDQQYGSLHGVEQTLPDWNNHGGADYLPRLLAQLKQTQVAGNLKPLDIFSVHDHPQGGEFGNDTSTAMQLTSEQIDTLPLGPELCRSNVDQR